MVEEGRVEVEKNVAFARSVGINVPEDLTALNHAVASDAGAIGNDKFWALAKDPRYMTMKMRELYGTTEAPAAPPRGSVKKPPVPPATPKATPKKIGIDSEIEQLQKQRSEALDKTSLGGREGADWGVKAQDLWCRIESLREKKKKG
jgi:hypothetical protein